MFTSHTLNHSIIFFFWINKLLKYTSESFTDKIIGIDARGFIFASVFADRTSLPLVLARKKGKLPGDVESNTYDLEYGAATIEIKKDSIELHKLTNDKKYQEKFARERYLMRKKNEDIFIIKEQKK